MKFTATCIDLIFLLGHREHITDIFTHPAVLELVWSCVYDQLLNPSPIYAFLLALFLVSTNSFGYLHAGI